MTSKKQIESKIEKEVSNEISKKEDKKKMDISENQELKQSTKKDKIMKKKMGDKSSDKQGDKSSDKQGDKPSDKSSDKTDDKDLKKNVILQEKEQIQEQKSDVKPKEKAKKRGKKEKTELESGDVKETVDKELKIKKKQVKSLIPRGRTGYNIFLKEKIGNFSDVPQKDRMKLVGELWKTTSAEEKEKFNSIANEEKKNLPIPETKKSDKKRKLSGYNIFMKENIASASGDSQRDKLMQVSQKWKHLDIKEKEEYNLKSKM